MVFYILASFPLVVFVGFALVLGVIRNRERKRWAPASRDRLLRPAGETLRLEIERLDEAFNDVFQTIAFCILIPLLFGIFAIGLTEGYLKWLIVSSSAIFGSIAVVVLFFKVVRIIDRRHCYKLGFDGERLVGEYLNLLLSDGYFVFHDVPFKGFNVDHVVVGPAGVFAIETKTRRKRKDLKDSHKVVFDGKMLHWPSGDQNDFGVNNAFDRAISLQKWLSSAVGTSISAKPMLVFPGWMVQEQALGKVRVLNPKNVRGHIKALERNGTQLTDQLIRQINHQLTEKVRLPE